ncbi:MAG: radical SAM protein [Desulfosarcinaceae bacterium]|nr:radical SAM protein [Desulfosarcinaceae bacterium]
MPDILLLQPPIRDFYLTRKRTQPYGLACLAACLRTAGFSVAILDGLASRKSRIRPLPAEMQHLRAAYPHMDLSPLALFYPFRHFGYSLDHMAQRVADASPLLVGISANFSAYAEEAMALARRVKSLCPQVPLVVGGHHATALPEALMAEPAVDFVICGEGEAALVALATALKQRSPSGEVPGLARRAADGAIHLPAVPVVADLEACPPPALDLIDQRFYQRHGKRSIVITASRGCPFDCSYCCMTRKGPLPYRRRSVASVLAELDLGIALDKTPVGFIDFEDEHLTLDKAWCHALLEGIVARFAHMPPELRAMNGLYPPSLDRPLVAHMARAGFKQLNLALASTTPAQLRRFNRPDASAAFDRCLEWAAAEGLDAVGYLIVGALDQNPIDSVRDLVFLARRRVLAGISVFYPAPGSRDYARCRQRGHLPTSLRLLRSSALPMDHATRRRQSVTLMRLGRLTNFIKAVIDAGDELPVPSLCPAWVDPKLDRYRMGRVLLAGFLADQLVRGVDSDGRVYRQPVDPHLCRQFHEALRGRPLRGVSTAHACVYPN